MDFTQSFKLEDYIIGTKWEDFPEGIKERAVVCAIDLITALILGSKGKQFQSGIDLVKSTYKNGNVPVIGSSERFSFAGAAMAMGHASNSFDIDDGHNMIKGHPGASIVGGILAAALDKDISYKEFLTTLIVAYEVAIRSGLAIQDHYNYLHSTGSYGAVGTSAGVSRIFKLDKYQLNNAISIADFHAPMTPVMRAVEYPSMNKDGVPFGTLIGIMSVLETLVGVTGKTHLLECKEYAYILDTLGKDYEVMNLYFKPYTCCRWAHPPIEASIDLIKEHNIEIKQIERIHVFTFQSAALLSKMKPQYTDEAQYNISFPIAAAIVDGDLGFDQVKEENLNREEITDLMERIHFIVDDGIEARFPRERLCRVEFILKDGRSYQSDLLGPKGEASDHINLDWIIKKFKKRTGTMIHEKNQDELLDILTNIEGHSISEIVRCINKNLLV